MTPNFFRKKPVTISAMQFDGTPESAKAITEWMAAHGAPGLPAYTEQKSLAIDTLEGTMTASVNDWVIRGVKGEFYPCKPDIFAESYEAAA